LLTQGLLSNGIVNQVAVITERLPGQPGRKFCDSSGVEIIRIFPHRAGGRMSKISQYIRYGIQNLLYTFLPGLVRQIQPDVVLVHSSLHNHFNLLTPALRRIAKRFPLIADVRDHQLPAKRFNQLEPYRAIIACSLNVLHHIGASDSLTGRIRHIPVIQEDLGLRENATSSLKRHGLCGVSYLLFAGLIKPDKGINLLLDAYKVLCSRGRAEELVLVGQAKDSKLIATASAIPGVRSLGPLPRAELLDLMSRTRLVVNLSGSEGMPRTSLEAIALGAQVALPAGIPEFEEHCHGNVIHSRNPEVVADDLERLLNSTAIPGYPVSEHRVDRVCRLYGEIFENARYWKNHEEWT
jgi:glycosyltransferase involved in cell wall biosynthesis